MTETGRMPSLAARYAEVLSADGATWQQLARRLAGLYGVQYHGEAGAARALGWLEEHGRAEAVRADGCPVLWRRPRRAQAAQETPAGPAPA
jgi:hypothetical protein